MRDLLNLTLADQIYSILREDIINQRIKCGDKLTLKTLQERFHISITPIREAIKRLSQEGLVEHVTNVGAKIIEIKEKDIIEIYDYCSLLDAAALKLVLNSKNLNSAILDLDHCLKLQEYCLMQENIPDFKNHSDDFHDILFTYADNSRLYDASKRIRSQFSILANRYQNYIHVDSVVFKEHQEIYQAIKSKENSAAIQLMENHFEHAKVYLLNNIKNTFD